MNNKVSKFIKIKTILSKSINLDRDQNAFEPIDNYILTPNALHNIANVVNVCSSTENSNKSWSLIGTYGSGKSSFALFLSHLLSNPKSKMHKQALEKLNKHSPQFKRSIERQLKNSTGYCRVLLTGHPEALTISFLKSLKKSIVSYYGELKINSKQIAKNIDILLARDDVNLSEITELIYSIQNAIAKYGGKGLLIIIDELGKFLEYSARHENDDIFLLQILAEMAFNTGKSKLLLFVLLHQSFEQYGKHLSPKLKNEWTKIQGRYEVVSFVETTNQTIHIMAQAFERVLSTTKFKSIKDKIKQITHTLEKNNLLPASIHANEAIELFTQCYPLHPTTLILLPVLCQKIAQNERTLFSYLGGPDPLSLINQIKDLDFGKFIYPADIFDYFMSAHILSNDFQIQRTQTEIYSALDRVRAEIPDDIALTKTIGIFNIAGNIRASKEVLKLCTPRFDLIINKLLDQSIVTYRKFNNEYRVWQGSDFDLQKELAEQLAQLTALDIAKEINESEVFQPIVAKRYSIDHHSLFYFEPVFINSTQYKEINKAVEKPRIILCFSENKYESELFHKEAIYYFSEQDICVLLQNGQDIKQTSKNRIALENIFRQNSAIQHDPIIQREFKLYLTNAKQQEKLQLKQIIDNPRKGIWFSKGRKVKLNKKRDVQKLLSETLEDIYPVTPIIKNELINRDYPSGQAIAGRKQLLLSLLNCKDKENLGITGYPAEKSMYRAILYDSGMHQRINNEWSIQPPMDSNFLKVWQIISKYIDSTQEQAKNFADLETILNKPPFGIKKPVLPIFFITFYLYKKNEIAVYEDRFYVPYFTKEHLERFLKRPNTFSFQQFKIEGVTQELIQEYENSLFYGQNIENAQEIFKAIAVFIKNLPNYTSRTNNLSDLAKKVRNAFKYPKNPQDLLFKKLPKACGFSSNSVVGFGSELKKALQEIKNAYPNMVRQQIDMLMGKFEVSNKMMLKSRMTQYCEVLADYTIDKDIAEFVRHASNEHGESEQYFERIFTFVVGKPSKEWNDHESVFASQKLSEYAKLVLNLYQLREYHTKNKLAFQESLIKDDIKKKLIQLSDDKKMMIISELLRDIAKERKTVKTKSIKKYA